MEETLSEVQEALRTSSEARNEASLQEEIEALKVIIRSYDDSAQSHIKVCILVS